MANVPMDVAVPKVELPVEEPPAKPAPTLFSKAFLRYAGERALKTLGQVVGGLVTASAATGKVSLAFAGVSILGAVVLSLCTSVVAATSSVPGE